MLTTIEEITELFELPFFELVNRAYTTHQKHFKNTHVELCALLSVKTGACPEDCAYCPQSGHYKTGLQKEKLMSVEQVVERAKSAQANGAQRFCMGFAWRNPSAKDFPQVLAMVKAVKELGMETCVTAGMLTAEQALQLKEIGLDFYNHNLDTSPEFYNKVITTRNYQDRLETIQHIVNADLNVCCGGILGLGETRDDRIRFLLALTQLPKAPQSIPINKLIKIKGTPLENTPAVEPLEFVRTIAVARLLFPTSMIRLSAGREEMSEELQAWCFMAGANSIFIGDKLLTAKNPELDQDRALLAKLNLSAKTENFSPACC